MTDLPTTKQEKIFDFVSGMQMQLAGFQKSHCCMMFGSPESMTDAMEIFFADLENHIGFLYEYITYKYAISHGGYVHDVDERILALLTSAYSEKKPSKKITLCRAQLLLSIAYLCGSFRALDKSDVREAIAKLGRGELFFGQYMGTAGATFADDAIEMIAKRGAEARLQKDPKQAAKLQVRECWDRWQKNKHEYKSKSSFSRAMLDKYECLENQRVIERWCKEWESEPS